MIGIGELRERFTFRRRALDTNGAPLGDWESNSAFTMAARLIFIRGAEQTLQGRLQGVQPVAITVRASAAARGLDNSWGAVNARTGEAFNITAVEPTQKRGNPDAPGKIERGFLDILATRDGSDGG